jgi:hypothetical protein
MKNAAVATTTARGAAVSSSKITAVQSVYIPAGTKSLSSSQFNRTAAIPPPMPARSRDSSTPSRPRRGLLPLVVTAGACLISLPGWAGVQFVNCARGPGGSITCDTAPTGNTLMNDIDARYGLLQQASPGWSEFDPYAGYNQDFGGNDT